MLGSADGNVLERIAKIMSYMRPALVGKSGKRLKRKEKLRMLADGGEAPLNGHLHGSLKPPPPQSAPVIIPGILRFTLSSYCGPHTSLTSVPPYCICQAILHILDLCPALLHLSGPLSVTPWPYGLVLGKQAMLIRELSLIGKRCLQEETEKKAAKPVDDDDDIFGDAGTNYEPELPKSKASNEATPAPAAGSYFDKKDEMADLPALPKAGMPQCRAVTVRSQTLLC